MAKQFLLLGSLFGFLGVLIGAFAAHALKTKLSPEFFNIFEVGVRYHFYHSLALIGVAWAMTQYSNNWISFAGWCFTFGIIVFSGSLYILALSGVKSWGAITPIGGLFFLSGWLFLFFGVLKS